MSEQQNPPAEQKQSYEQIMESKPGPFDFSAVLKDEDFINHAITTLSETLSAVQDIPAQLDFLAKVTLARSFIGMNAETGRRDFDSVGFTACWKYLSDEKEGENT